MPKIKNNNNKKKLKKMHKNNKENNNIKITKSKVEIQNFVVM